MKSIKYASLLLIAFVSIMGCSGSYQELKTKPVNDSTITHQELIGNWSDYNIVFHIRDSVGFAAIAFDPKNDNRKIVVASNWDTIKDQETWKEFVKEHTTHDGHFKMTGGNITPSQSREATGVREIWGPDNQHYGFVVHQQYRDWMIGKQIDDNILQIAYHPPIAGSPAK